MIKVTFFTHTIEYIGNEKQVVTQHNIATPKVNVSTKALRVAADIFLKTDGFPKNELAEGYEFMKLLGKAGYPLVQLEINRQRF